jgi:hypothetical protein
MSGREPGSNGSTEDEVWRDLVARLEQTPSMDELTSLDSDAGRTEDPLDGRPGRGTPGAAGPERTGQERTGPEGLKPADGGSSPSSGSGGSAHGGSDAGERVRAIFANQPLIRPAPAARPTGARPPESSRAGTPPGGPRDYAAADDGEEGFIPPDPPPLGAGDPMVVLAWIGAAGGPLALLLASMFWRSLPAAAIVGIVAVFIASVGYLVYRLPQHRDNDDDDGAVV